MRVGRGPRVIWRWHPENSSFCLLGKKWDISGIIFSSPLGFLTACPIPVQENLEKQQSPGAGPAPDLPTLPLDLQVHGELGNIYGNKNFYWPMIKLYGKKMTQVLGFRRKMQEKMVQIPTKKSNPSCPFAS